MVSGEDEHPGTDQLISEREWPGWQTRIPAVMPAASARMSLRPSAIWRRLLNGFVEVAAFGGVSHGGAVQSAVEKFVFGGYVQRIEHRFD
jgi:hypothetical protein